MIYTGPVAMLRALAHARFDFTAARLLQFETTFNFMFINKFIVCSPWGAYIV